MLVQLRQGWCKLHCQIPECGSFSEVYVLWIFDYFRLTVKMYENKMLVVSDISSFLFNLGLKRKVSGICHIEHFIENSYW